jgi:cation transport ATPase
MTHTYAIEGMTCGSCVARVKSELLKLGDVTEAKIQLAAPQAEITMQKHIPVTSLQKALSKAGSFKISEKHHVDTIANTVQKVQQSWLQTYKPILIIGAYILGIAALVELLNEYSWNRWMLNFMAGFFLTFSFFKMLDLKGFADSYATYDIIAKRWKGWGYVYAVLELALGLAFLLRFELFITYGLTIVIMSLSMVGVLQTILNRRTIRCACLGTVFNLPMSTITFLEDGLMIIMSAVMMLTMI